MSIKGFSVGGNVERYDYNFLDNRPSGITIDTALSDSSTNPVQNRIITSAINSANGSISSISGEVADLKSAIDDIGNETYSAIKLNWEHGGIDNANGQLNNEGSLVRSRVVEYYKESDLYKWENPNNYSAYGIRYSLSNGVYTFVNSLPLYAGGATYYFNRSSNYYVRFDIREGLERAGTTSLYGYKKIVKDIANLNAFHSEAVRSWNSTLHEGLTDFETPCAKFSDLMIGDTVNGVDAVSECESFLFFTDPHTQHTPWSSHFEEYMGQIQKVYHSTPTNFVLCGGDWLGSSDTPSEACYKMGLIGASCRSMLSPCYMLVGNHDTNYQGKKDSASALYTTRLPNESISNLWYGGKKAYYSFDGSHTKFYCFDTGTEAQTLAQFDNYGYEQGEWFAQSLIDDDAEHSAIALHMYYTNNEETSWSAIAHLIMQVASAYNKRRSITINGVVFDFANTTGKVEFAIAGHTHFDSSHRFTEDDADIPVIITKDAGNGTTYPTDASFDLVFVDYDNRKIKCIRVGNGTDRTFDLASA